ncbi:MAG: hypothetical protein ACR5LG_05730 [Sodalis sp. (in: enterobacteria)]|uniref:hypothetical protein n=1 Tax=Sodalis sp. (in: enterobacteria) TaxID=1898979 RepID=UPI003F3F0270
MTAAVSPPPLDGENCLIRSIAGFTTVTFHAIIALYFRPDRAPVCLTGGGADWFFAFHRRAVWCGRISNKPKKDYAHTFKQR